MSDAFISYSRKDGEFTRRLNNELAKLGRDIWIDWEDIPRGTDFLNEIYEGIESADTFLFVVSRHSLTSEICNFELAHARKFNKRIIPLIRQQIAGDLEKIIKGEWVDLPWGQTARDNWNAISHINWLSFDTDEEAKFEQEFAELIETLDTDLAHVKQHTRLLVQALDWQRGAQNPSFLLIGDEITAAETWLAQSSGKQPEVDPLHRDFITASRHAEDERAARILEMERRTRRSQRAALIAGLLVVLALIGAVLASSSAIVATSAQQTAVAGANAANLDVTSVRATLTPIVATLQSFNAQIATFSPTLTAISLTVAVDEAYRRSLLFASESNNALVNQESPHDAELAVLLAIYGLNNAYTISADTALMSALDSLAAMPVYTNHRALLVSVKFSPNGRYALSASQDRTAQLWDIISLQEVQRFDHDDFVYSALFSPDNHHILTASTDGIARLWDKTTGEELLSFNGYGGSLITAALSPDGQYILTGSTDGTARLWNITTGQELQRFYHNHQVTSVTFSPDGRYILTGSSDSYARMWDIITNLPVRVFNKDNQGITSVAFSPDGKSIVAGSLNNTILLWDTDTRKLLQQFVGHSNYVTSIAFSPDGTKILSGSADSTARLWNIATGEEIRRLVGHTSAINGVAFSPDGRYILTASSDTNARLWNTDYKDFVIYACSRLSRDFTDNERQQYDISVDEITCPHFGGWSTSPTITPIAITATIPVWTPIASPTQSLTPTITLTPTP